MRILHVNSLQAGGAAWCAIRINKALVQQGVESRMLFAHGKTLPEGIDGDIARRDVKLSMCSNPIFVKFRHLLMRIPWYINVEKMQKNLDKSNSQHLYLHQPLSNYSDIVNHPLFEWADIIHLHWVADFIDYPTFFKGIKKPIVWTLHDQYPALGVMHFESEYTVRPKELDKIDYLCRKIKKKGLLKAKYIHLVAISEMMKEIISSSDLLKSFSVELIHNGVDTGIFRRVNCDWSLVSDFLSSLEKDTKVFLFSSYNICDKRKGLYRLFTALDMLQNVKRCNVALIVVGNIDKEIKEDTSFPIYCTGLVKSQTELAKIYSSVDFFVNASYEEGFAQTPLEAMACGTPVITTPCSGDTDLIKPFNGVICSGYCADSLVEGIIRALKIEYDSDAIRLHIIERYDYSKIANKYIKLYKSIRLACNRAKNI